MVEINNDSCSQDIGAPYTRSKGKANYVYNNLNDVSAFLWRASRVIADFHTIIMQRILEDCLQLYRSITKSLKFISSLL